MVRRIAVSTIACAILVTGGKPGDATPVASVTSLLKAADRVESSTPFAQPHSDCSRLQNASEKSQLLIATESFDAAKFKSTFEQDPQFLAWASRMPAFLRFLEEKDLIGMTQEKVTEELGPGQLLDDPAAPPDENKNPAESGNGRAGYLLTTRISGATVLATGVQLEYKDGKVARWRLYCSTHHYPISSPKEVYQVNQVSRWIDENVVESDICDFGLKIKKSMGFASPDKTNDAFEDTRPPFLVVGEKKLPTTKEPYSLVLLPQQPTSAELLNTAVLCQQSLLVKASREFAERALTAAKTDADKKKARAFIESRLPLKTPRWSTEKRHLESYAASKRKEPEAAIDGYEQNIREEPGFEYSYYMVGMLKREKLNFAGAQNMFEKVLAINPKYQKALFGLAAIKMQSGDTNVARKMALQAYFLYPYDASSKSIYHSIVNEDPPQKPPADLYGANKTPSKKR